MIGLAPVFRTGNHTPPPRSSGGYRPTNERSRPMKLKSKLKAGALFENHNQSR